MIGIHPEGKHIISIGGIVIIGLLLVSSLFLPILFFIPVAIILCIVLILIVRFFRIPARQYAVAPGHVIAPADGKVVAIEKVKEDEYFHDERILVSIFMSIHNVHINWFPIEGIISYFKYHPGKYLVARHPKSSQLNERSTIVIKNDTQEILVRQIAGYVARRIICYANPDRKVKQSEEMGFIRFGSRLDLYLPADSKPVVSIGDKTTGGVTAIA